MEDKIATLCVFSQMCEGEETRWEIQGQNQDVYAAVYSCDGHREQVVNWYLDITSVETVTVKSLGVCQ